MASMEKEDFWGCELSKASSEVTWNPEFDGEDSMLGQIEHKLVLSQACLGNKAQGRTMIQVTAMDFKGEDCTSTIVSLRQGATEMCALNLAFSPPVVFKLADGAGPVHLTGNHVQSLTEDDESSGEESEDEELTLEEAIKPEANKAQKRPLPASAAKVPTKKAKADEESDEEDSDDDESDEDYEMEVETKPAKKSEKKVEQKKVENLVKGEAEEESSEEGADDEDESDEDDEDEESDDEDESDEEEESEDEVTEALTAKKKGDAKKPVTNGVKKAETKTPTKTAVDKKAQKKQTPAKDTAASPTKKPNTPKGTPAKDLDSIKQSLLKSPAIPKKIEKFKNLMKSSYKVTDDKTVSEVWDFLQKNKK